MQLAVLASTVTAMVCLVWYLRAGMSHLSYGKRLQCRLDRMKTRRMRMNPQRQLLAVIFLCGMSSAHAMEGQTEQATMQEAFLQRMTTMAEAATRAAIAAEEAL